jgi:hypothetical protein
MNDYILHALLFTSSAYLAIVCFDSIYHEVALYSPPLSAKNTNTLVFLKLSKCINPDVICIDKHQTCIQTFDPIYEHGRTPAVSGSGP